MTCGLTWYLFDLTGLLLGYKNKKAHVFLKKYLVTPVNFLTSDSTLILGLKSIKLAKVFLKIYLVTPGHNKKLFVKLFYIDCRFKILKISKSFLENLPGHTWSHLVTCPKNSKLSLDLIPTISFEV